MKVIQCFLVILVFTEICFCHEPLTVSQNYFKEHGAFSCIIEGLFFHSDHFWNHNGKRCSAYNTLKQIQVDLYFEYGFTDVDTFGFYTYYIRNNEELNGISHGLSEWNLCWKHYLTNFAGHDISVRIEGVVPAMLCPTRKKISTVRYGSLGAELDLHCQKNFLFFDLTCWYEALLGYRYYHGYPSDQIKANVIIGSDLSPGLRLVGSLYLDYGLYNGCEEFKGIMLSLPPRYRLLKSQLHCVIAINRFISAFIGSYQNIWGEELGIGVGYFGGLWLDY